jgi:O-antigen ligase
MMREQFFGKEFRLILAALAGTFVVSAVAFETPFAAVITLAAGLVALGFTLKRLEWGIAVAFAELFANSNGHLTDTTLGGFVVSMRMAAFAGVMLGYAILVARRKAALPVRDPRLAPFLLLAAAVAIALVLGSRANGFGNAFADGNAYLYAAYVLPILSVRWDAMRQRLLLQTLAAGTVWVTILTLGLVFVFSHVDPAVLGGVYRFVRDTRTAELTMLAPGVYRVFLQAQISVGFFLTLISPLLWSKVSRKERWIRVAIFALASAVISISFSRSFWVGLTVAGIVSLALMVRYMTVPWRQTVSAGVSYATGIVLSFALIAIIILSPPRIASFGSLEGLFAARGTDTADNAIDSRAKLFTPMLDDIEANPLIGYGFAKTVTFVSDDPRVRAQHPDGLWTTYSFEWGWLDLWLKMGVLGVIAFVWIFAAAVNGLWDGVKGPHAWLHVGLICSLVMLAVTHAFSPYLNHPLGIGILLFLLPFMQTKTPAAADVSVDKEEEEAAPAVQPSTAPLTSE